MIGERTLVRQRRSTSSSSSVHGQTALTPTHALLPLPCAGQRSPPSVGSIEGREGAEIEPHLTDSFMTFGSSMPLLFDKVQSIDCGRLRGSRGTERRERGVSCIACACYAVLDAQGPRLSVSSCDWCLHVWRHVAGMPSANVLRWSVWSPIQIVCSVSES